MNDVEGDVSSNDYAVKLARIVMMNNEGSWDYAVLAVPQLMLRVRSGHKSRQVLIPPASVTRMIVRWLDQMRLWCHKNTWRTRTKMLCELS
ncbi:Uncharacterized protein HZ326_3160 [Fusarium oxysporum f. sp. albedinis]|nr:Uncharacterized protein HZ326_3160 [Fusarium oxysporum f. sp. albedinis]